jgi:hypothetical protein
VTTPPSGHRHDIPVLSIAISGLPRRCPSCGGTPDHFPLSYGKYQVTAVCPDCFSIVGRIVAVNPPDEVDGELDDMCQGMIP